MQYEDNYLEDQDDMQEQMADLSTKDMQLNYIKDVLCEQLYKQDQFLYDNDAKISIRYSAYSIETLGLLLLLVISIVCVYFFL